MKKKLNQMNKKGQGAIIAMSIGLILAVVILGVIFSQLRDQTTTSAVIGDQFTGINRTCVRITPDCYTPGSLALSNASNTSTEKDIAGNFTECGNSNVVLFGAIGNIIECEECENTLALNASYSKRSCGYITNATTRTLVNLLPVLLAIAILIFILGFVALKGRS